MLDRLHLTWLGVSFFFLSLLEMLSMIQLQSLYGYLSECLLGCWRAERACSAMGQGEETERKINLGVIHLC